MLAPGLRLSWCELDGATLPVVTYDPDTPAGAVVVELGNCGHEGDGAFYVLPDDAIATLAEQRLRFDDLIDVAVPAGLVPTALLLVHRDEAGDDAGEQIRRGEAWPLVIGIR